MEHAAKYSVHYCPCGAPAHPATGCQYTATMVICGRCVRDTWKWVEKHTKTYKRVGKTKVFVPFYT